MPEAKAPWTLRIGGAIVALLCATSLAAPLLAPHDPYELIDPAASHLLPPRTSREVVRLKGGERRLAEEVRRSGDGIEMVRLGRTTNLPASELAPDGAGGRGTRHVFPLGSDRFGRDVASRLLFGGRISLGIGIGSAALALVFGLLVGGLAALGGPLVDALLMRATDALLAVPSLFLIIAFATLIPAGVASTLALFGLTSWMQVARVARAEILSLKSRDFILAAKTIGLGPLAIFFRHILPNTWTPLLVQATLLIGNIILAESALSFIGLGIQPPTPSWGNMIAEGREVLTQAWWISVFPGTALALTAVGFNLLGDGVRDFFDPRSAQAGRL